MPNSANSQEKFVPTGVVRMVFAPEVFVTATLGTLEMIAVKLCVLQDSIMMRVLRLV